MPMPICRDIFFDLDGTLADSFPGIDFSARRAMAEVFPGRPAPDFRPYIGPPIREIFRRALPENDPLVLEALNTAFRRSYDGEGWARTVTYPGVLETLAAVRAKGYRCHVLTNKPLQPTVRILRHLGLMPHLSEIIAPESRQPPFGSKVEAALHTRDRLGLATGEAMIVGDSTDDAAAAAACGFQFVAVTYGYGNVAQTTEYTRHFLLVQFSQFTRILPPDPITQPDNTPSR